MTTEPATTASSRSKGVWYAVVALFAATAVFTPIRIAYKNGDEPEGGAGTVVMANTQYGPGTLPVAAGTTVTFRNEDVVPHTVSADDGSFTSGAIQPGEQFELPFDATVAYHCEFHPQMHARIEVTG